MMLHLAVSSRGHCLLSRTGRDWVSSGLKICRWSCLRRSPPGTPALKSSTVTWPFYPQRWLTREPLPMRGFNPKYKKDNVPTTFALIYRKFMTDKVFLLFYGIAGALSCLLGSIYFLVKLMINYDNSEYVVIPYTDFKIRAYILHYGLIGVSIFCMPLFLHVGFMRNAVIRMYYNSESETFIGIVKNNFRKKKVEFKLSDVEPVVMRDTGRLRKTDNLIIKNTPYTIFEPDFINSQYISLVMRYT